MVGIIQWLMLRASPDFLWWLLPMIALLILRGAAMLIDRFLIDLDTRDISGKFDLGCKGTARLR